MLLDLRLLYENSDAPQFFDGQAQPDTHPGRAVSRQRTFHSWRGKLRASDDQLQSITSRWRVKVHLARLDAGGDQLGHAEAFRQRVLLMHTGRLINHADVLHAERASSSQFQEARDRGDEDLLLGDD